MDSLLELSAMSEVSDEVSDRIEALEQRILVGPIASKIDVLAKLEVLRVNLEAGTRSDRADIKAIDVISGWIEQYAPPAGARAVAA
jgi:hypothetical protein